MPLSTGQRLGAYEIVCPLGTGGMGEVYRARDSKLGREVALKILPPDMTNEAGRLERFDREARAIAALNHPHIVTIYSTEQADGIRFLTMELVDGCTLGDLVISTGMALPRFLDIATPLADALAAAHQKQITHRDLKPGNVMVSNDGRVKVLDFGLARVGGADHGEQTLVETLAPITHQGMIVGTMPYMSPEQVEGQPIDARSDLFSLGVIFYELLAGERPFKGGSSPALMSSILRDSPSSISERRTDLPESLLRLIDRLIEKRPEDRVQTARDVFNELKHIRKQVDSSAARPSTASGAAIPPPHNLWIAVLPLGVRGSDQDAIDLAAGLTDDIATSLAKFPLFNVVAAQSTRAYKDSALDIRQIADRLGARYVIGGQARKSARAIRVTAQLIDAASGAQLWSESYDRDTSNADLFAIQDDITDHIVATIGDQSGVLARSMVKSVRAHLPAAEQTSRELLLRAWGLQHNPVPSEHAALRDAIEARVTIEKDNADLWAELAHLYLDEHILLLNERPDALSRATRAARRAVEIDPNNQRGWSELAGACFFAKDRAGLFDGAERVVAINPRNAHCLGWIGNMLSHAGEYDRGSALSERAMSINRSHPGWLHFAVFNREFAAGNYEAALQAARRVNMPELNWTFFTIAAAAAHLGLMDEARRAFDRMCEISPSLADPQAVRQMTELWHWQPEQVESLIEGIERARSGERSQVRERSSHSGAGVRSQVSKPPSSSSGARTAVTVAVRAFTARSADSLQPLADGITEDVATNLARFGYLRVVTRAESARFVIEGSIRSVASQVRITARLLDTQSSEHLWADTFDRPADRLSEAQDDVAARIAATIADEDGVIIHALAEPLLGKPLEHLTVDELVIRMRLYTEQIEGGTNAQLTRMLEAALAANASHATGWACLSILYGHAIMFGLDAPADAVVHQMRAAERAIAIDSKNQDGWFGMAMKATLTRDLAALREASERCVAINPLSGYSTVSCAVFLALAGDYDRALEIYQRAESLPTHQDWYYLVPMFRSYHRKEYADALRYAQRVTVPMFLRGPLITAAAAAAQLGRTADALAALEGLRRTTPELLDLSAARQYLQAWMWNDAEIDALMQGFDKARALQNAKPPSSTSGAALALTDLSVAVLPFGARGGDTAASSIADGLTDAITTGLSRFGYLRVLSRSVTERLAPAHADIHTHARYAIEGNVREDGGTVRIAVTLVDTGSGRNLWTSTYDRDLSGGAFAIQDDVASAVVATIGDQTGVLMRSMAAATADRPLDQLTTGELVIRYHLYAESFDPAEHARLREALERALEREPRAAEGWACLSLLYEHEHSFGFNPRHDSRVRERRAAQRALELDPNSQQAWIAMAGSYCFAHDREALKNAVERAASINPLNAELLALGAIFLSVAGEHDRAVALVQQAMRLKPQHAGWYYFPLVNIASQRGDHEEALRTVKKINMPRMPLPHANAAAFAGRLGLADEARAALAALRNIDPRLAEPEGARALWTRWIWSESWIESMVDGFLKALALDEPSASTHEQSIAVLPFTDLSEKKDQDWFCDGIAEEIMSALAPLPGLRVAARASAFSFRGKADDLEAIGEKLHVETVLEGSVRRSGDRVRITTQLNDTKLGKVLWSERFDRDLKDIFDVQDEIARAIVERLRVTMAGTGERLVHKRTGNIKAYELLLQGRTLLMKRGPSIMKAITCFEQAIALDPNLAAAHAGLGDTYRLMGIYGLLPPNEVVPKAKASLERALSLDPNDVEAIATMANIAMALDWDFDRAAVLSERALTLDPTHVRATVERGITYATAMASPPKAQQRQFVREKMDRGLALDPLSAWVMAINALGRSILEEHDAAIASATRAREIDPGNFTAHWALVIAFAHAGRDQEARLAAEESFPTFKRHPVILAQLAAIHARHGETAEAEAIFQELQERSASTYIGEAVRATAAAAAGRMADAKELLVSAIAARDAFLAFHKQPAWQPLKANPDCMALLQEIAYIKNAPR